MEDRQALYIAVSRKTLPYYFLNNSIKNEAILITLADDVLMITLAIRRCHLVCLTCKM